MLGTWADLARGGERRRAKQYSDDELLRVFECIDLPKKGPRPPVHRIDPGCSGRRLPCQRPWQLQREPSPLCDRRSIDTDKSGEIDRPELQAALKQINPHADDSTAPRQATKSGALLVALLDAHRAAVGAPRPMERGSH